MTKISGTWTWPKEITVYQYGTRVNRQSREQDKADQGDWWDWPFKIQEARTLENIRLWLCGCLNLCCTRITFHTWSVGRRKRSELVLRGAEPMASIDEAVARCVDFSQPLDVGIYEAIVTAAYQPGNPQQPVAQRALVHLQEHPGRQNEINNYIHWIIFNNTLWLFIIFKMTSQNKRWNEKKCGSEQTPSWSKQHLQTQNSSVLWSFPRQLSQDGRSDPKNVERGRELTISTFWKCKFLLHKLADPYHFGPLVWVFILLHFKWFIFTTLPPPCPTPNIWLPF